MGRFLHKPNDEAGPAPLRQGVILPVLNFDSQLALYALGATLIFGIPRFANFAHGDTMTFGTMVGALATW